MKKNYIKNLSTLIFTLFFVFGFQACTKQTRGSNGSVIRPASNKNKTAQVKAPAPKVASSTNVGKKPTPPASSMTIPPKPTAPTILKAIPLNKTNSTASSTQQSYIPNAIPLRKANIMDCQNISFQDNGYKNFLKDNAQAFMSLDANVYPKYASESRVYRTHCPAFRIRVLGEDFLDLKRKSSLQLDQVKVVLGFTDDGTTIDQKRFPSLTYSIERTNSTQKILNSKSALVKSVDYQIQGRFKKNSQRHFANQAERNFHQNAPEFLDMVITSESKTSTNKNNTLLKHWSLQMMNTQNPSPQSNLTRFNSISDIHWNDFEHEDMGTNKGLVRVNGATDRVFNQ